MGTAFLLALWIMWLAGLVAGSISAPEHYGYWLRFLVNGFIGALTYVGALVIIMAIWGPR